MAYTVLPKLACFIAWGFVLLRGFGDYKESWNKHPRWGLKSGCHRASHPGVLLEYWCSLNGCLYLFTKWQQWLKFITFNPYSTFSVSFLLATTPPTTALSHEEAILWSVSVVNSGIAIEVQPQLLWLLYFLGLMPDFIHKCVFIYICTSICNEYINIYIINPWFIY